MSKPVSEVWTGEAVVSGAATLSAPPYPRRILFTFPGSQDRVILHIHGPEARDGQLKQSTWRQRLSVEVAAPESRALVATDHVVSQFADICSFAAGCPVTVQIGQLMTMRNGKPVSLVQMIRVRGQGQSCLIGGEDFQYLAERVGDSGSARSRKLGRALRWLRKSLVEEGLIEEFAALAYAMEAVGNLLPDPSTAAEVRLADTSQTTGNALRLREWATGAMDVPETDWKRVGGCRNNLFHGGLIQSPEGDLELARACTDLRYVLNGALKHLLDLTTAAAPVNGRPLAVASLPYLCIPGLVVTHTDAQLHAQDDPQGPETGNNSGKANWPSTAVEQLGAVKKVASLVGPEVEAITAAFEGADVGLVRRHLETLVVMGEV